MRQKLAVLSTGFMLAALGAAWAGTPEQEVAPREVGQIAVDPARVPTIAPAAAFVPTGAIVDDAEPNDTPATAQALPSLPARVRGKLFRQPFVAGNVDVDVFSFTTAPGSRVYAATMTQWSSGSTDTEIDILDVDGTTVLETDDDDGALSSLSSAIGGTVLTAGGTYYVRVRQGSVTSISGTIRPYDLYVRVTSGTPMPEVEPNNDPSTATALPAGGWVSGTIDPAPDPDWFSLTANAGDTIVAILDGDPERDTPDWNARIGIGIFNNFYLVVDGAPLAGDGAPAEAFFITAKTTGTYYVAVEDPGGLGAPTSTYHLSVFVIPARSRTCTTYTGTGGAITDLGTTDFTINVADARVLDYLKVSLAITHPLLTDLDVTLLSPDGNEVFLFDDPGNIAGVGTPQINVTLEDEAGFPMSLFSVHSGMHYIPEVGGRLEYFKGMQAQGTWILRVRDDATSNTGTVDSWSITVCDPEPRPACIVPGPAETTVYGSDFEADDGGFTHNGTADEWERGLPAFAPITTAHSGTNAWKTDLDNTYDPSSNQNLVSPSIDLTAVTGRITLSWWQKFQIETPSFDRYWVDVQQVGQPSTAVRLFDWTGSTMTRGVGSPLVTVQQSAGWGLVQADISSFAGQMVEVVYHFESDSSVQFAGVGIDDVRVSQCTQVAGAAPEALAVDTAGNRVYEPDETVVVEPTWRNTQPTVLALSGELTNHTGPAGATYSIPDGDADYGAIAVGGTASCTATANCYSVANVMTARPAVHWDSTALETVTAPFASKEWTLHIGGSFTDVLPANPFYRFVETLLHNSVTGGCGADTYCPSNSTLREQMAVFVLVAKEGAGYAPPACVAGSEVFSDVPASSPFCRFIEELFNRGVVTGCATGQYCPANPVQRDQMAVFVLRTLDPTLNPPACVAGSEVFADVPASSPFCRWVEELFNRGVVTGCGGGNYCPTNPVTREQMGVFISVTFGLALYGV